MSPLLHLVTIAVTLASAASSDCTDDRDAEAIEVVGNIDPALNDMQQDDPELIRIIREKYLIPPSKLPYNLTKKAGLNLDGQYGQPGVVDAMLRQKVKRGFFVEAGAFDGEFLSNSLYFEIKHQWTGLLVEPNPDAFKLLKAKNRRAWLLNNCLSTKTTPEIVEFDAAGLLGGIINKTIDELPADREINAVKKDAKEEYNDHWLLQFDRRRVRVQCFPLYSVLMAVGNPTVHYLTLDIEGGELPVLKTVPWDKVDMKILDIESNHIGTIFPGTPRDMNKLLYKGGFEFFRALHIDQLFVKRGFDFDNTIN